MATVEQRQNVIRRMSQEKASLLAGEALLLFRSGSKDVSLLSHAIGSCCLLSHVLTPL